MQGLRIYSPKSFAETFAGVLPLLAGRTWLALPESFRYPLDWLSEDDDEVQCSLSKRIAAFETIARAVEQRSPFRVAQSGYVIGPGLFPEYADMVSGDWASLFGMREPVENAQTWLDGYYGQARRDTYLSAHCDVVLHSVDSAFYEIFAAQAELDACRWHLEAHAMRYEAVGLADCAHL